MLVENIVDGGVWREGKGKGSTYLSVTSVRNKIKGCQCAATSNIYILSVPRQLAYALFWIPSKAFLFPYVPAELLR